MVQKIRQLKYNFQRNILLCVCNISKSVTSFCIIFLLYIQQIYLNHPTLQKHAWNIDEISRYHIHTKICTGLFILTKQKWYTHVINSNIIRNNDKIPKLGLPQRRWQQHDVWFELIGGKSSTPEINQRQNTLPVCHDGSFLPKLLVNIISIETPQA
jgi:hypothetical protein